MISCLRGLGQCLRQGERRQSLDDGGRQHHADQRIKQLQVPLADDVVDQVFGRGGQDQPGDAVDHHQPKPSASKARRGRISSQISGSALKMGVFGLSAFAGFSGIQVRLDSAQRHWVRKPPFVQR